MRDISGLCPTDMQYSTVEEEKAPEPRATQTFWASLGWDHSSVSSGHIYTDNRSCWSSEHPQGDTGPNQEGRKGITV